MPNAKRTVFRNEPISRQRHDARNRSQPLVNCDVTFRARAGWPGAPKPNEAKSRLVREPKLRASRGDHPCSKHAFAAMFQQPEAIEFCKHAHRWTDRLIAGDSLLDKEGMAGKNEAPTQEPGIICACPNALARLSCPRRVYPYGRAL